MPLRVEIGPKDIEAGHCVAVRRDNGEKITVALDELEARIPALLEDVQQGLFDKAKRNLDEHTYAGALAGRGQGAAGEKRRLHQDHVVRATSPASSR